MRKNLTVTTLSAALVAALAMTGSAFAQKKYDTGATDKEIKIGNIMPYSGPASAYGSIGKTQEAYFKKINDEGGINGRRINFISYDDGYVSARTVEQARKLVESDEVLLIFDPLGTQNNVAIRKYMNDQKVPQLFVATGGTMWGDPKNFPWTMGWQPNYQTEGRIYAKHIMETRPNGKIAVLYQNDDYGKDLLKGLKDGLGAKANMIVAEAAYEVSEPTVDSHIVKLQASGADVYISITTPKASAQSLKKVHELGWKPALHIVNNVGASIGSVIQPAGYETAQGIITAYYQKDTTDAQWKDDAGMKEWNAFIDKYMPGANKADQNLVYGYATARTLAQALKQSGDDLTRANVMKQAASLKDFDTGMLLPGIKINTSATDFFPIEQMQLQRFKDKSWELFGNVIAGEIRD